MTDEHKVVKCFKNDSSVLNHILNDLLVEDNFFPEETDIGSNKILSEEADISSDHSESLPIRDQIVEEPWLFQPSSLSHHFAESDASGVVVVDDNEYFKCLDNDDLDTRFLNQSSANGEPGIEYLVEVDTTDKNSDFSGTCYGSGFPFEEPWLFESTINYSSCNDEMNSDVSTCEEYARSEEAYHTRHNEHHQKPEKLLPVENIVISEKDSVTTVILINSSICTMQRIAVLENGRLVELLLEPVKNNVQCDSVYLGVVTKLVPQMNGAFVNIGCRQTAFMNIISKKELFIFPQFCDDTKGREINGFESDKFAEKSELPETEATSNEAIEDDDIDDSIEYIDNDFEENENHDRIDASEVLEGNGTGNVDYGVETHLLKSLNKFEKNGHHEDNKKLEQESNRCKVMLKDESKRAQVRKGTKIIVQVVKEGLGTKGPVLTAYPKLRSRFWVYDIHCSSFIASG